MKNKIVKVNDKMQRNYSYILSEPEGSNFHVEFKPELNPKKLLSMGIFGGKYMNDCTNEFPASWYMYAKTSNNFKDINLNFYKVNASLPLSHWKNKGWIHQDDPRGWFQWYCRYFMGRRSETEDLRQIKRWKSIKRHLGQIKKNCSIGDLQCRKKQRQALLHWAYDSTKI